MKMCLREFTCMQILRQYAILFSYSWYFCWVSCMLRILLSFVEINIWSSTKQHVICHTDPPALGVSLECHSVISSASGNACHVMSMMICILTNNSISYYVLGNLFICQSYLTYVPSDLQSKAPSGPFSYAQLPRPTSATLPAGPISSIIKMRLSVLPSVHMSW